ncbi:PAS domain S-box protein [Fuerstiella marisgermanici]|uniref:Sensor protein FixL n=1 Tax=Fuerstiella marisgermanici TaxID=1891926 RepID=A0A1P8WA99_9PLAN|nr:PAS domain S-box protein [Fuerstiella marisgermanici]APZ90988.1 Sensor protein FixL [Fuerstiella marisgermanici]
MKTDLPNLRNIDDHLLLRAVLNNAVDGIITIDESGIMAAVNPAAEELFGYSAQEMIGQNVKMLMPSPYHESHDRYLANYARTNKPQIIGVGRDVRGRRKDGTSFPLYLAVSEVRSGDRRIFTGFLHDLTELRKAEDQATRLGRIIESSLNEIYIFDLETFRFVFMNHGAADNLGYTIDELMHMSPLHVKPEFTRESLEEKIEPLLSGEKTVVQFNTVHLRRDKSRYDVAVRLHTTSWFDRPAIVAIVEDISEKCESQRRLLQSERLAAIGQVVTGLAHESRNALQRSQACLDMLTLDLEGQPEQLELTNRIRRAMDDLHRHYEEVRNYAAPINLEWRRTDIRNLIQQTWQHLESVRSEHRCEIVVPDGAEDSTCDVDSHRLEQVFRNIMENALAACPDAGRLTVSCIEVTEAHQPCLRIAFQDSGPGFTAESAENVFVPFFSTRQKGTGLGMAICKRIVEAHNGRIEVGNHADGGGEVVVVLPRKRASIELRDVAPDLPSPRHSS